MCEMDGNIQIWLLSLRNIIYDMNISQFSIYYFAFFVKIERMKDKSKKIQ
jgi:hypothetical protein